MFLPVQINWTLQLLYSVCYALGGCVPVAEVVQLCLSHYFEYKRENQAIGSFVFNEQTRYVQMTPEHYKRIKEELEKSK